METIIKKVTKTTIIPTDKKNKRIIIEFMPDDEKLYVYHNFSTKNLLLHIVIQIINELRKI